MVYKVALSLKASSPKPCMYFSFPLACNIPCPPHRPSVEYPNSTGDRVGHDLKTGQRGTEEEEEKEEEEKEEDMIYLTAIG